MFRMIFVTAATLASLTSLSATAGAATNCPAWSSARCVQYSCTGPVIGGKCTCVRYQCVADKKSDPPKSLSRR